MRKIKLLCVGNIKEKFFSLAMDEYTKRLSRFCDLTIMELTEFPDNIEKEADAILKNLSGAVILFDRIGENVSSEQFADLIAKSYLCGKDTVTLIIGGSNGVSERVKAAASHKISFGRVTYPHRLMRIISAEQIYRAFTIIENMPYHK